MSDDSFHQAEVVEKNSTIIIVAVSAVAILLLYSNVISSIGEMLNIGGGTAVVIFAVLVNAGLVYYQISSGKTINKLCKRPYI
jgi:divalent metal cation (Fe/Co/Zn/Cd) transporter